MSAQVKNKGGRPKAGPITKEQIRDLEQLYYHDGFTVGRQKLYKLAQERGYNIPRAKVAEWLKSQNLQQIFAPTTKRKTVRISIQKKPFAQIAIDLGDMQNLEHDGYKYILTVVDTFSKLIDATPLKSKDANEVLKAFKKVLAKPGFKNTESVRSDRGTEFTNDKFKNYLKAKGITQILSSAGTPSSNGQVEVSNKIIKTLIRKYITLTDSMDWPTVLPAIVDNYNQTVHFTTNKTPKELSKVTDTQELANVESKLRKKTVQRVGTINSAPKFKVGDIVRIKQDMESRDRLAFTFSPELFFIKKVFNPKSELTAPSYSIVDADGEKVDGRFYETDLLAVPKVDHEIKLPEKYEVSKLVEPVIINGKQAYIVAWKNYRKLSDRTVELRSELIKDIPKLVAATERENKIDWKKVRKVRTV